MTVMMMMMMMMMGMGHDSLLLVISFLFLSAMQPGPHIEQVNNLREFLQRHTVLMKCQEMSVLAIARRMLHDNPTKTSPRSKQ